MRVETEPVQMRDQDEGYLVRQFSSLLNIHTLTIAQALAILNVGCICSVSMAPMRARLGFLASI